MRRDARDHAEATDPLLTTLRGMVRRMAISLTAKALWQLVGFRQADGSSETRSAETFSGIGFYARPPGDGKPEAIVLMVGDSKNPVIVGTRDEKTRAASAGGLDEDEAMVFNSQAVVYVKSDGTVEVRRTAGLVEPTIKGTTYRTAETTLIAAIVAAFAAINTYAVAIKPTADPTNAATPALTTALATTLVNAVATFNAGAASYLSTVLKGE